MSKNTEQPQQDKVEQQRIERAERIKRLKGKDGLKKQIKVGHGKVSRIVLPIVLSLAIIGGLIWGAFSLGIVHRFISPMTVGDTKLSLVEYNYHYASYFQTYNQYAQYGYAPADALGKLDLKAKTGLTGYEETTWGDYLHVITQQSIQQVVAFAEAAKDDDISLTDESKTAIDSFFAGINKELTSDVQRSNYYEEVYGRGANESTLRPVLERTMLANQFAAERPTSFDISESEIDAYYDGHKDEFDGVEYRLFTMTVPAAEKDATDEDKEKLKKETADKADEMLGKLTDFDSMKELAIEYAGENKADYKLNDLTYFANRKAAGIGNSVISEWLFDAERKAGDKTVLNSGSNYFIVYFNARELSDELYPSVRHILFAADEEKATEEERAAAKKTAEEALAKVSNEADMIALSEELLASKAAAEATIYENVARGTMVAPFEDWIYDTENKAGDTGVVETTFGYHVMYLVGRSENPIWYEDIESTLQSEAFAEETDKLLDHHRFDVSLNNLGIRLAGY